MTAIWIVAGLAVAAAASILTFRARADRSADMGAVSHQWITSTGSVPTRIRAAEQSLPRHADMKVSGGPLAQTILARGAVLDRVLDARWRASGEGLNRQAFGRFHAAQMKTAWASRCQSTCALIAGETILASAERYELAGVFDGRPIGVCGIGSVWSEPSPHGAAHARTLIETILDGAEAAGVEMAVLFSHTAGGAERSDFETIPLTDLTLAVTQSRRGAPMTTVRGGEERDLAAIVAMGRVRAGAQRLHLDRDVDFLQYVITTKRLLAGLGPANARQLHFFIAEEGITAAAYVIVSVVGHAWTLEECGDRDPSGARVGALLQALDRAGARRTAPDDPGVAAAGFPASAGHHRIRDAVDRHHRRAHAQLRGDRTAPARRRRPVLARQLPVAKAGRQALLSAVVQLTQRHAVRARNLLKQRVMTFEKQSLLAVSAR